MSRPSTPLMERILNKFIPEPNSGCWLWIGYVDNGGYGRIGIGGKYGAIVNAHRVTWESEHGPIPEGLQIDHLCRVRCCVNPRHLEPVTNRENTLRGLCADVNRTRMLARTHCFRGHAYSEANTYIDTRGNRNCRVCLRARTIARNARIKHGQ